MQIKCYLGRLVHTVLESNDNTCCCTHQMQHILFTVYSSVLFNQDISLI